MVQREGLEIISGTESNQIIFASVFRNSNIKTLCLLSSGGVHSLLKSSRSFHVKYIKMGISSKATHFPWNHTSHHHHKDLGGCRPRTRANTTSSNKQMILAASLVRPREGASCRHHRESTTCSSTTAFRSRAARSRTFGSSFASGCTTPT